MKTFGKIILVIFIIVLIAGNIVLAKLWYDADKNYNDMTAKYENMEEAYVKASTALMEMSSRSDEIDKKYNRSIDNVKLEVVEGSVTANGLELMITDTSDVPYPWGEEYTLEKKVNETWEKMTPIKEVEFEDTVYKMDENSQAKQVIDWTERYGSLESGTYRVWKNIQTVTGEINVESNEFTIE